MCLKSCPFCEISQVSINYVDNIDMEDLYNVTCGACGSHTPSFEDKELAKAFWNTRSTARKEDHCPICNQTAELLNVEINGQKTTLHNIKCTNCNFSSGISRDKESIKKGWKNDTSRI